MTPPRDVAERRRFLVAVWTPTVTTLGAIVVALATAWSGCQDVRDDVQALSRSVDAQTRAVEQLTRRVDAVDDRALRARDEARAARAACAACAAP